MDSYFLCFNVIGSDRGRDSFDLYAFCSECFTSNLLSFFTEAKEFQGFNKAADNHAIRNKYITEFYLLAERQRFSFCTLGHNSIFKNHVRPTFTES